MATPRVEPPEGSSTGATTQHGSLPPSGLDRAAKRIFERILPPVSDKADWQEAEEILKTGERYLMSLWESESDLTNPLARRKHEVHLGILIKAVLRCLYFPDSPSKADTARDTLVQKVGLLPGFDALFWQVMGRSASFKALADPAVHQEVLREASSPTLTSSDATLSPSGTRTEAGVAARVDKAERKRLATVNREILGGTAENADFAGAREAAFSGERELEELAKTMAALDQAQRLTARVRAKGRIGDAIETMVACLYFPSDEGAGAPDPNNPTEAHRVRTELITANGLLPAFALLFRIATDRSLSNALRAAPVEPPELSPQADPTTVKGKLYLLAGTYSKSRQVMEAQAAQVFEAARKRAQERNEAMDEDYLTAAGNRYAKRALIEAISTATGISKDKAQTEADQLVNDAQKMENSVDYAQDILIEYLARHGVKIPF